MASGYSQPGSTYRHLQPVDIYDEQLVATVLGAKQQKYDANVAKIDAAIEQYGGIDLLRSKDKEYLNKRLNNLSSDINNAGMQDLSSSAVTRNIMQHIDQAQDEYVMEQAVTTASIRAFGEKVDAIKKKNPELYAEQNEAYALHNAGFQDYMSGGADQLKSKLEYSSYVDVSKNKRDILDEAASVKHGITRGVPSAEAPGYFVESTHYGLDPADVRRKVISSLTPQELKQLETDAWAKYGEGASEAYESYAAPKLLELNGEKESLMLNFGGKTEAEKAIIEAKVAEIDATVSDIGAVKESPSALYSFLGREGLVGELSAQYAPVETSVKYSADTAYFKSIENAAKQAQTAMGSNGYDQDGNGIIDVSTRSKLTENEDQNHSAVLNAEKEIETHRGELSKMYTVAYERLDPEKQKSFDTAYQKYIEEQGISDNEANKATFMLNNSSNGRGEYFDASEVRIASAIDRDYRVKLKNQAENYDEALAEQEAVNAEKIFGALKDNPGIKILDENGKTVSASSYLEGVDTVGELSKEQKKTLLTSVHADFALSSSTNYVRGEEGKLQSANAYNISKLAKTLGETGEDLPIIVNRLQIVESAYSDSMYKNNFEKMKGRMQLPASLTKAQFEKHIRPLISNTGIDKFGKAVGTITGGNLFNNMVGGLVANLSSEFGSTTASSSIIIGGEGTKTRESLERALKAGTYDKISLWDDSVEDDTTIRLALEDKGDFTKRYEAKMAEDGELYAQNKEFIVEPSGSRKGTEIAAFEDLNRFADFDNKKAIYVSESGVDGFYRVYQRTAKVTNTDGAQVSKATTVSVDVAKKDLEGFPFMEWVKQDESSKRINTGNTKELASGNIGFADEKNQRGYLVGVGKELGVQSEEDLAKYSSQGAKRSLLKNHPDLFSDTPEGKEWKNLAKQMVDNSHLFRVNIIANDRDMYDLAIQYKEGDEWSNLRVMPTGTNDITETVAKIDIAPQQFYLQYMEKLFSTIEDAGDEVVEDDLKILRKLFLR